MVSAAEFKERLGKFAQAMVPDSVAILRSPPEAIRNGTSHYVYRASSNIWYLTGFAEPQTTLVIRPGAEAPVTMFVRPRDPEREVWDGRRAGVEGVIDQFGVAAFPAQELRSRLPGLLGNSKAIYYSLGYEAEFDNFICKTLLDLRNGERRGTRAPRAVLDTRDILGEMRIMKSPGEIALMQKAADIAGEGHVAAMKLAKPGVYEYELEAVLGQTFRKHGGNGPGYSTIVGRGENATILHYIENNQAIRDGDMVLIDAGCEYQYYTSDITRTFPAGKRFTPEQKAVYEIVLACQEKAIAMCQPGNTLDDIHNFCVQELTQGMIELGLLQGTASERINDDSYKRFYMHRTSHWLGIDVHDAGAYYLEDGSARKLASGMVITIEPGLYISQNTPDIKPNFLGLGVRIEDDIAITDSGPKVLTSKTPKKVGDIEALVTS